jgi:hypothetical protein
MTLPRAEFTPDQEALMEALFETIHNEAENKIPLAATVNVLAHMLTRAIIMLSDTREEAIKHMDLLRDVVREDWVTSDGGEQLQ